MGTPLAVLRWGCRCQPESDRLSRVKDTGGQNILVLEGVKGVKWPTRGMEREVKRLGPLGGNWIPLGRDHRGCARTVCDREVPGPPPEAKRVARGRLMFWVS